MGLAPEGIKLLAGGAAATVLGAALCFWSKWAGLPLLVIGAAFTLFSAYFFRDPARDRVFAPAEIACPADGTVLSVGIEKDPEIMVVRIFLSILNVHIQRSPMDGKVESVACTRGKFAVAYKPQARENARNRIAITGEQGRFAHVEQITGAIARRLAVYVKAGDSVKISDRLGMIYFGSQVAVYLPKNTRVLVKPGEKVYGAETVLGLW
ncbi:MAG: phosphatidylserine decarboxylase family protein [Elusimicrobia bacterium]|nr:phosphatidylserine decarboxylase family protein [Elusimicrobiota bacterium]